MIHGTDADESAQRAVLLLLGRLHHDPRNVTSMVVMQSGVLVVDSGTPHWHRFTPRRPASEGPPPAPADPPTHPGDVTPGGPFL